LLDDFAIDRETDAGDHRLLVNVETTATGMQDFHDALLTRRRLGDPTTRTLQIVLRGQMMARGDRLRCSRIPGSNYETGLTHQGKPDLRADGATEVDPTGKLVEGGDGPVGEREETTP